MAVSVSISPEIEAYRDYDQLVAHDYQFLVIKDDTQYYTPYMGTLKWSARLSDDTTISGKKEYTGLSSTYYPPWVDITIPANTFPAGAMVSFTMTFYYKITVNGVTGDNIQSYYSPNFFTVYPPRISRHIPDAGTYINDRESNRFSWELRYTRNDAYGTIKFPQASAVLQWRDGAAGAIRSINVSGATQEVEIPASTFPVATAALQWRVTATMTDGARAEYSDWQTLTTVDSLSTARIAAPNGAYLTGNEPNSFSWEHVVATGTAQTKAELQYSSNGGGSWTALKTVTGAAKSTIIAANTLPGGSLLWRVRTYNSDSAAGSWSTPAALVVWAAPRAPGLLPVDPVPRPLIRWQSAEQQAFEVRAGDWSSGPVFGTAKEYRVPVWLENGTRVIGVRVQSSLGLWSEWASLTITVANVPPGEVKLFARGIENGVRLSWAGGCASYLVYRDGEEIGETTEVSWEDWLANGKHQYRVRGVSGANYALSNEVAELSCCRYGVLSALDSIDWIVLRLRRGSQPGHSVESARPVTLRYFSGRSLPVAEVAEFTDRVHTLDYTLRREERALLPRLRELVGRTVIYKDRRGARVIGLLQSLGEECDGAIDLTLSIVETDWRESDE